MLVFCYIPTQCLPSTGDLSQHVRALTEHAIALGLSPAKLPRGVASTSVRIGEDLLESIDRIAQMHQGLARGRVIGGLIYALYLTSHESQPTDAHHSGEGLGLVTTCLRPSQIRCLLESAPHLASGKIVAAECGTGSGKSRLIAHACDYVLSLRDAGRIPPLPPRIDLQSPASDNTLMPWVLKHCRIAQEVFVQRLVDQPTAARRTVIITAPSIENVSHLARELSAVNPLLDPKGTRTTRIVLGRSQFVSVSQLQVLMDDASDAGEDYSAITKWIQDGMPTGQLPATAYLGAIEPTLCGLMADLEVVCAGTTLAYSHAALDDDSPESESELYKALRKKAFDADIVLTTHAMLAMDNLRLASSDSSSLLPAPLAVFIDEAHLLEQIQASVAAKSFSFLRLNHELRLQDWSIIKAGSTASKAIASAKLIMQALAEMPNETPLPIGLTNDSQLVAMWDRCREPMQDLKHHLSELKKRSSRKGLEISPQLSSAIRYVDKAFAALQNIEKDYRGYVEQSPKRGCLSFNIGPSTVDKYLAGRWATTPTVMLLSGTLHHYGSGVSLNTFFKEICVDLSRGAVTAPVVPSWVMDTPTIYMPSPEIVDSFTPPTNELMDSEAMQAWLTQCAHAIALAASDSAGGMLVLMTGYDRLEGLSNVLLKHHPELSTRIIVQKRSSRMASYIPVFKAMARAGSRPIWFATGSAWTGLDLADELVSDDNPQDDIILTDLVMPNLPFGLHRSTTHVSRTSKIGFGVETRAVQRLFRQGLGRGVRRSGLLNRRYWILDGRLQQPSAASYTKDIRRVLVNYMHRKPFRL